jgi:hypothetical protein
LGMPCTRAHIDTSQSQVPLTVVTDIVERDVSLAVK